MILMYHTGRGVLYTYPQFFPRFSLREKGARVYIEAKGCLKGVWRRFDF